MKEIKFTEEEIKYILDLVEMSEDSLKDLLDAVGNVADWVDFTNQKEVDEEQNLIDSIKEKLELI